MMETQTFSTRELEEAQGDGRGKLSRLGQGQGHAAAPPSGLGRVARVGEAGVV